jgi:hypothetical protein
VTAQHDAPRESQLAEQAGTRTAYDGIYVCDTEGVWRYAATGDPVPGAITLPDGRLFAPELLPGELVDSAGAARLLGYAGGARTISRLLASRRQARTVHPIPPPVADHSGPVWPAPPLRHWRGTQPVRSSDSRTGWRYPTPADDAAAASTDDEQLFGQVAAEVDLPDDASDQQVRAHIREDPEVDGDDERFAAVYEWLRRQGARPKAALVYAYIDAEEELRTGRPRSAAVAVTRTPSRLAVFAAPPCRPPRSVKRPRCDGERRPLFEGPDAPADDEHTPARDSRTGGHPPG